MELNFLSETILLFLTLMPYLDMFLWTVKAKNRIFGAPNNCQSSHKFSGGPNLKCGLQVSFCKAHILEKLKMAISQKR